MQKQTIDKEKKQKKSYLIGIQNAMFLWRENDFRGIHIEESAG